MAPQLTVRRFDDRDALDRSVADRLLDACTRPTSRARAAVMLTGGSTPQRAYALAAARGGRARSDLHVLYTDERYVPIDSQASNYRASRVLLDALQVPDERRIRVRTELPLAQAVEDYEKRLARLRDAGMGIGLGVLGLGADGHIASLFSPAHLAAAAGHLAIAVSRPDGRDAVSVTPELLAQVAEPVFVVAGTDKRAATAALVRRDPALIAWRAIEGCARVELWVDAEAYGQERDQL